MNFEDLQSGKVSGKTRGLIASIEGRFYISFCNTNLRNYIHLKMTFFHPTDNQINRLSVDASCPSQQFYSHILMFPGLNQY